MSEASDTLVFDLTHLIDGDVDASGLRLDGLKHLNIDQIKSQRLPMTSGSVEVGELFSVERRPRQFDDVDQPLDWSLSGDLSRFHGLFKEHWIGRVRVDGNVGDFCCACMSGGRVIIKGNAGNQAGGPFGSRGTGMNGGQLEIHGDAGHLAGHRMRRGELRIAGNAGDQLAAWQIAGTIWVDGHAGSQIAFGMRRGTIVFKNVAKLNDDGFTPPRALRTAFTDVLEKSPLTYDVRRGDRRINGVGEIWMPATST